MTASIGQNLRRCLREPIPEIFEAARLLDAAVGSHLAGEKETASHLLSQANMPGIRSWTESVWGAKSVYVQVRPVVSTQIVVTARVPERMPTDAEKMQLHARDGYHCRFCHIPVIRAKVRARFVSSYPDSVSWGRSNVTQHAAFQCMWAQYDHVVPHASGGDNSMDNLVVACSACNFGRMNYSLAAVGLLDPRETPRCEAAWDGLERFLG